MKIVEYKEAMNSSLTRSVRIQVQNNQNKSRDSSLWICFGKNVTQRHQMRKRKFRKSPCCRYFRSSFWTFETVSSVLFSLSSILCINESNSSNLAASLSIFTSVFAPTSEIKWLNVNPIFGTDSGSDHNIVMMSFRVRLTKARKQEQYRRRFNS